MQNKISSAYITILTLSLQVIESRSFGVCTTAVTNLIIPPSVTAYGINPLRE